MIVTYSKVAEQRNEECLVGSLELVGWQPGKEYLYESRNGL